MAHDINPIDLTTLKLEDVEKVIEDLPIRDRLELSRQAERMSRRVPERIDRDRLVNIANHIRALLQKDRALEVAMATLELSWTARSSADAAQENAKATRKTAEETHELAKWTKCLAIGTVVLAAVGALEPIFKFASFVWGLVTCS